MRKLIILLVLLLLCGCAAEKEVPAESIQPPSTEPTVAVTEPPVPWVEESGRPWDDLGALTELFLTVPGGMHYGNSIDFNGDLLLWSMDTHRADSAVLELCLIELDDGTVAAQREYALRGNLVPQALEDRLYLCDAEGGTVLQLDKNLEEVRRWNMEPQVGSGYMGAGEMLYQYRDDATIWAYSLTEGSEKPLIEGNPEVTMFCPQGDAISFQYYRPDTGAAVTAALNLLTNEIVTPDIREPYTDLALAADAWLTCRYENGYINHLNASQDGPVRIETGEEYLKLLEEAYLLLTSDDGNYLYLYDLQGNPVSGCQISSNGNYYLMDLIWNESLEGYFVQIVGFESDRRLLFWDVTQGSDCPALTLEPVAQLTEQEQALDLQARALSEKYGLNILVGSACEEDFDDFTASVITDYEQVSNALELMDTALSVYPEGFLAQLKGRYFNGIQIQLVSDLIATGNGREGDGYSAFTQNMWDYYLMVVDIDDASETTYYHEFSHIIDTVLELDSFDREDALFSEITWASYNPDWFEGYSYDYSVLPELEDCDSFVDSYAAISPTEDRARVMEFAMYEYGEWTFENCPGVLKKLDYYSRCIRDVFDTAGWPETVIWEQYL